MALPVPPNPPLRRARTAAPLLFGTLVPVLSTVLAGVALADTPGGFNRPAGVTAGALTAAAGAAWLLLRVPEQPAGPVPRATGITAPGDEAGLLPEVGITVHIHTHFGPRGGYIDHLGLLLWATPGGDDGSAGFTPGTPCVVSSVRSDGDTVDLTVGLSEPAGLPTNRTIR